MNGDAEEHDHEENESSDEEQAQRMVSLRERRKKYYEERKKKLAKRNQPSSFVDMLENSEASNSNNLETEKRYLNVKIRSKITRTPFSSSENLEDVIELKGELEIADFLTFEELITKTIDIFNSQLQEMKVNISLQKTSESKLGFRFAKKNGMPDTNFPQFENSQKVGDSGVTNL